MLPRAQPLETWECMMRNDLLQWRDKMKSDAETPSSTRLLHSAMSRGSTDVDYAFPLATQTQVVCGSCTWDITSGRLTSIGAIRCGAGCLNQTHLEFGGQGITSIAPDAFELDDLEGVMRM